MALCDHQGWMRRDTEWLPGQGVEWQEMGWGQLQPEAGAGGTAGKSQLLFPKAGSWGKANHLALRQSHKNPFLPAWIQRNKHSFTIHSAVLLNPVCLCIPIDVCCICWNPVTLLFPSLHDLLLLLLWKHIQCLLQSPFWAMERAQPTAGRFGWHHAAHKEKYLAKGGCEPRAGPKGDSSRQESQRPFLDGGSAEWCVKLCWESEPLVLCHSGRREPCRHPGQSELPSAAGCLQTAAPWHIYPLPLLYLTDPWGRDSFVSPDREGEYI